MGSFQKFSYRNKRSRKGEDVLCYSCEEFADKTGGTNTISGTFRFFVTSFGSEGVDYVYQHISIKNFENRIVKQSDLYSFRSILLNIYHVEIRCWGDFSDECVCVGFILFWDNAAAIRL